jgi:BirA family biotin operon repressor/biotin-[acetyl-CoA-carboxylase] ligase
MEDPKLFNFEDFDIKLNTEVIGRNFFYIEEVDSTNTLLLNSDKFNKQGTVLLAESQTAGKGRLNRDWISNKGQNLTFSILLTDEFLKGNLNIINLASSLTVAHAIENLFQLNVDLKWPNDVLIEGRKVAGILLESSSRGNQITRMVVGIGINVNQAQFSGKFNIPPSSIKLEFKKSVERERLLSELLNIFEELAVKAVEKPQEILDDWKSKCRMIGEKVKVDVGKEKKFGIFYDIDEYGQLVLKSGDEFEKINFGDVTLH